MLEIVERCLAADRKAVQAYGRLEELCDDPGLKRDLAQLVREECVHVSFWEGLRRVAAASPLPPLFDAPEEIIADLDRIAPVADGLLEACERSRSATDALILTYRFEMHLLHPAFELLFDALRGYAGDDAPDPAYAGHIQHVVDMLSRHGAASPALQLLGETLAILWKRNRVLALQATHDPLTGLLNRRGFFELARRQAFLAQRTGSRLGLIVLDLDDFRRVNDLHGHAGGDQALRQAARVLAARVRASDAAARFGGEEFVLVLAAPDEGATRAVAEALRRGVEELRPLGRLLTASFGVAEATMGPDPAASLDALLRQADDALYAAKREGKNRVAELRTSRESSLNS